jgi:cytidylate kinase
MPVITVSSSFGSGGSVIADLVAQALGWELHNRAIPAEVAARLSLPLDAALTHDEAAESRLGRLLARFSVQLGSEAVGSVPTEVLVGETTFMEQSEAIIRRLATSASCVIVGRAAAVVIGDSATALHVRLDGSPDRRAVQAAEALNITLEESRKRLAETDRARSLYVKHFYSRDWADPRLYHLVIDSTEFSLESSAQLVVAAAKARLG